MINIPLPPFLLYCIFLSPMINSFYMKQSFSAVIFDCARVIVDCNFHQFVSWKRLFEEEGIAFSMSDFQTKVSGVSREAGIRAVLGDIAPERIVELSQRKHEIFEKLIAIDTPSPFFGIKDLLSTLRRRNIALAATSVSKHARMLMQKTQLLSSFNTVLMPADQITPFNEKKLFVRAMKELQKNPKECVIVESSPSNIRRAKETDAFVIGVAIITSPDLLREADRVVMNHKELATLLLDLCPSFKLSSVK